MKVIEKKLYNCPICHTDYIDKQKALECLNFHSDIDNDKIVRAYYKSKNQGDSLPYKIEVIFKDGTTRFYKV